MRAGSQTPSSEGSHGVLKLVTLGRRSGLPHVVLVRFVLVQGRFLVLAGEGSSDWVLNARAAGAAKVRLGEYAYKVSAAPLSRQEREQALGVFEAKYGRAVVREWYRRPGAGLRLSPISPPSVRGAATGEHDVRTTLEGWRDGGNGYYSDVARAFDSASEEYDFTIRNNFINTWIRRRSIEELLALVNPEDVLVEIGCGTGAEAVEVSRHVSGVVATDISPGMIALLRRKVIASGLAERILPVILPASEIGKVAAHLPRGRARVVYSFNGALNCELGIEEFPARLWAVMEEGGYFVCSVRNTLCLSEAVAHGLVMQFARISPRKRQPTMVSVGGIDIPSYYYRPSQFTAFFSRHFVVRRMIALPSILPPAYLSDVYVRARKVLSFAERAEKALSGWFPFNRFGDQTLFIFQRRGEGRTDRG